MCLLAHSVRLSPARAASSAAYCAWVHRTAVGTAMGRLLHFPTTVSSWEALTCSCENNSLDFLSQIIHFLRWDIEHRLC